MQKATIAQLLSQLRSKRERVGQLKCFIGFDGYVDQIIRIVKSRSSLTDYDVFQKISHFTEFLQETSGKSAGLEMIPTEFKLGGNAPIMAYSLAKQGVRTVCAGTFGEPHLHPAFEELGHACESLTTGPPAVTYAFEFNDGKLMFGDVSSLNRMDWESLKQTIGLESIIRHCADSQLISIVNWSGILHIESILTGFLEEVFPQLAEHGLEDKLFFVDLADPSARTEEDLQMFIEMLHFLTKRTKVVLGLNEKEARIVCRTLGLNAFAETGTELKEMAESIYARLDISVLTVHASRRVVGIHEAGLVEADSFYVDNPLISTGAGDNFNSGFCLGQMLEFNMEHSLVLGHAVSSFYISKGYSPNLDELTAWLAAFANKGD